MHQRSEPSFDTSIYSRLRTRDVLDGPLHNRWSTTQEYCHARQGLFNVLLKSASFCNNYCLSLRSQGWRATLHDAAQVPTQVIPL